MTAARRASPVAVGALVLLGVLVVAVGWALTSRGALSSVVSGTLAMTLGVTVLLSAVSLQRRPIEADRARSDRALAPRPDQIDGEPAMRFPRGAGSSRVLAFAALGVLGLWAVVMIVLAIVRGAPLWLVLLVPWAVLVLGGPVLAATGRLAPGSVYVTPTRVVDVDRGGRAEIALVDVDLVTPMADRLLLRPRRPGAVVVRREAGPWSRRPRTDLLVVETTGLGGGSELLADHVRGVQGPRR
ncbi:hypothetical protein C8046_09530 [Serinibacter arcticus]|uniref:Uncharacterized protein n=1 Tax=Serinibacter arcticus TaxID=1655435 RepID=A0A2U1ZV39_9MICO|nr:hypothetical protein [Serinibacter arcticus]PWD50855.1 hypothetical protein C8046_09530 [Serinibacter arcticus]